MSIRIFQLQKPESNFINIEDCFKISKDNKIIALADGTTQGFQSKLWAQLLVDNFIKNPTFDKKDFKIFIQKCSEKYKSLSKNIENNYENKSIEWLANKKKLIGSSSTFIAININNSYYNAISYGDSKLFLIRNNKLIDSFPKNDYNVFIHSELKSFKNENIEISQDKIYNNDIILVVTDALGEFILKEFSYNNHTIMTSLNTFKDFKDIIESGFKNNKLEMDDISLIQIQINSKKTVTKYFPDNDFKYSKELLPSDIFKQKNISIPKGEKEMKQLIKSLKITKDNLNKEISEYKIITSQLIRMSYIQWTLISLFLIYSAYPILKDYYKKATDKIQEIVKVEENTNIENNENIDSKTPTQKEGTIQKGNAPSKSEENKSDNNKPEEL